MIRLFNDRTFTAMSLPDTLFTPRLRLRAPRADRPHGHRYATLRRSPAP